MQRSVEGCFTVKILAVLIIGYLLGSISVAVIVTKWILKDDVRQKGSRNAGATNVARVFGMGMGIATLLGDFAKAVASVLIGRAILGDMGAVIGGAGCMLGHSWPVYFGFKGGKGVAVGGAIALAIDPLIFLFLVAVFALAFILFKRVSAASLSCAAAFPIGFMLMGHTQSFEIIFSVFAAILVIFLHRANIVRLIKGEEPKFVAHFKKRGE